MVENHPQPLTTDEAAILAQLPAVRMPKGKSALFTDPWRPMKLPRFHRRRMSVRYLDLARLVDRGLIIEEQVREWDPETLDGFKLVVYTYLISKAGSQALLSYSKGIEDERNQARVVRAHGG